MFIYDDYNDYNFMINILIIKLKTYFFPQIKHYI